MRSPGWVKTHFSPTMETRSLCRLESMDARAMLGRSIRLVTGIRQGKLFVSSGGLLSFNYRLRGGEAGNGNAIGTGRNIVEFVSVAKLDRFGISSVFAANSHFQIFFDFA